MYCRFLNEETDQIYDHFSIHSMLFLKDYVKNYFCPQLPQIHLRKHTTFLKFLIFS